MDTKLSLLLGILLCLALGFSNSAKISSAVDVVNYATRDVSPGLVQYQEVDDSKCPSVSLVAQRRQSIFKNMIRRWRLNIESQQPWDSWSRKIIKCSLGKQLYRALGPESKIHMTENIRAVLKRELKVRQKEFAKAEMKKNPCHPFLAERGKLKAILKFRASMVLARKPVIYLYPETVSPVNVSVSLKDGEFTTLYPKMNSRSQWEVQATPTGLLTDLSSGKKLKYLFWEANRPSGFSVQDGTVVKGRESEVFLENALSALGLNDAERNDFIVYWLPELEKSPFNLISFSTEEYNNWSQLTINPPPKVLIRVFMTFMPLQNEIPSTPFSPPTAVKRAGFTVVEWGGAEIKI